MARLLVAALILAEVASFVLVGRWIGVLGTLLLVILATLAGAALLRRQGGEAMAAMRRTMDLGRDPRPALLRGGFQLVAALLLILPGFVSDLAALALLVPAVQRAVARSLAARGARMTALRTEFYAARPAPSHPPRDRIVEAEWEEVAPPKRPTHPPSGWTRH